MDKTVSDSQITLKLQTPTLHRHNHQQPTTIHPQCSRNLPNIIIEERKITTTTTTDSQFLMTNPDLVHHLQITKLQKLLEHMDTYGRNQILQWPICLGTIGCHLFHAQSRTTPTKSGNISSHVS
jgi:hypothetical protein